MELCKSYVWDACLPGITREPLKLKNPDFEKSTVSMKIGKTYTFLFFRNDGSKVLSNCFVYNQNSLPLIAW